MVAAGVAHHITQRGNNQQRVFDTEFDRRLFLEMLSERAARHGLVLWGYCLMPNHFHLIAVPEEEESMAYTMRRLAADYARYFNTRQGTNGHLWQARFFSTPMDDRYRWRALAYVERNPVRAGMVGCATSYPWSSAAARLGMASHPEWLELDEWRLHWSREEWLRQLEDPGGEQDFRGELKRATMGGHPLGSELTERLEVELGISLQRRKPGRPRGKMGGVAAG